MRESNQFQLKKKNGREKPDLYLFGSAPAAGHFIGGGGS